MSTIKIGKHTVEIYDNIEVLPVVRYHKYSKMLLIEAGIGSGVAATDAHLQKIEAFIRQGKKEDALQQLENMRQSLAFTAGEISPKLLAFAALVKSVDGKEITDITDDGLQATAKMLGDAPFKDVNAAFDEAKKKIDEELRLYFPRLYDDAETKEYYDKLRRRVLCQLKAIQAGGALDCNTELTQRTDEVLTFQSPRQYAGNNGAEVKHDKGFESLCLALAQGLHIDPKNKTVMEYYNAVEYAQDEAKRKQKQLNKKR